MICSEGGASERSIPGSRSWVSELKLLLILPRVSIPGAARSFRDDGRPTSGRSCEFVGEYISGKKAGC